MLWLQIILWSTVGYSNQYSKGVPAPWEDLWFYWPWMTEGSCPVGTDTKSHVISLAVVVLTHPSWNQNKEGCHFMIMGLLTLWDGVHLPEDIHSSPSLCQTSSCPIWTYSHSAHKAGGFSILLPKQRVYQQVLTVTALENLLSLLSSSFPILFSSIMCSIVKCQLQDKLPIVLNFDQHPLKYSWMK